VKYPNPDLIPLRQGLSDSRSEGIRQLREAIQSPVIYIYRCEDIIDNINTVYSLSSVYTHQNIIITFRLGLNHTGELRLA